MLDDQVADADLDALIQRGDLDGLIRMIDDRCSTHDWAGVLRVRDDSRRAVETGRQLWPAATLAEYRLALLADPEYVELQVSDGLRPRADVQRAINAAAAAAATLNQTIDLEDDEDAPGDELIVALIDDKEVVQKAPSFSLIPGVAGVVRAKLDPLRSARRAYEYIHGVGWVLEMYYTGACLDYGYHFQYSPREHNQGIAAAIDKKALDANSFTAGTTAFKANKSRNTTDVAAAAAAAAAANAAASQGSGGSGSGYRGIARDRAGSRGIRPPIDWINLINWPTPN